MVYFAHNNLPRSGTGQQKGASPMNYRKVIDPQLRHVAVNIPFGRAIIGPANAFLSLWCALTPVPRGLSHKHIRITGYGGRKTKVLVLEPCTPGRKRPCLVYIHGGAFSYRAAAYHKKSACLYALRAGCTVFLPDYSLAPRRPYPAAYNDILALYRCILAEADVLGVDRERVGVAGDSAGGALAASLCAGCGREGLEAPCLQLLVYPVTDGAMSTPSMERFRDTPLWNAKNNRLMWAYYCDGLDESQKRLASPLHAELSCPPPPAYIETAQFDCLHDEGLLYAQKLKDAGGDVVVNETEGTFHGYDIVENADVTKDSMKKRVDFLKSRFSARQDLRGDGAQVT